MVFYKYLILLSTVLACSLVIDAIQPDFAVEQVSSPSGNLAAATSHAREKKWSLRYLPQPAPTYYNDYYGRPVIYGNPYAYPKYLLERHPRPNDHQYYYY